MSKPMVYKSIVAELGRVRAERDALLASLLGHRPAEAGGDVTFDEWWTAHLPRRDMPPRTGGWRVEFERDTFPTREAAEAAILAAAMAAADQRAKGGAGEAKGGA